MERKTIFSIINNYHKSLPSSLGYGTTGEKTELAAANVLKQIVFNVAMELDTNISLLAQAEQNKRAELTQEINLIVESTFNLIDDLHTFLTLTGLTDNQALIEVLSVVSARCSMMLKLVRVGKTLGYIQLEPGVEKKLKEYEMPLS